MLTLFIGYSNSANVTTNSIPKSALHPGEADDGTQTYLTSVTNDVPAVQAPTRKRVSRSERKAIKEYCPQSSGIVSQPPPSMPLFDPARHAPS